MIAGLLLLVPAMLAAAGCAGPTHPRVGLRAPQFDLPRLRDTEFFGTADLQGTATVVVFWAAGCRPCAEQLQLLERTWQRHHSESLMVLGIQQGLLLEPDDPGFARANGVTFPNVRDTSGAVAASFGVTGVPETTFSTGSSVCARSTGARMSESTRVGASPLERDLARPA